MRLPLILFSLALTACNIAFASGCPVQIKNIEFCRDKGKLGATCAYWLNAKETKRRIPKAQWDRVRFGMTCTNEEGMGNVNAIIEKLCQSKQCVQQVSDLISVLKE